MGIKKMMTDEGINTVINGVMNDKIIQRWSHPKGRWETLQSFSTIGQRRRLIRLNFIVSYIIDGHVFRIKPEVEDIVSKEECKIRKELIITHKYNNIFYGKIVELEPRLTSADEYHKLQMDFEKSVNGEWTIMIPLYDDQKTDRGVYYYYDLVSQYGAIYTAIQLPENSKEDIEYAKRYIKDNFDAIKINVINIVKLYQGERYDKQSKV